MYDLPTARYDAPETHVVVCPNTPRYEGDLVGCGGQFPSRPDEEGFEDCPHCGLWFRAESSLPASA